MTVHLYLAPAASGKTAYVLGLVREAAQGLESTPRLVVPSHLQVRACRRRLAEAGGAIGVRLLTFDGLYAECLGAAREATAELSDPVQYRLMRAIVDQLPLAHYAPLAGRPGFIQVLMRLAGELKAARVRPEAFTEAVAALGDGPRLGELALVYSAYQARLQVQGWADRAGLGWLAAEALEERAPQVGRDWPLLAVDGFDSFTPIQLALLRVLAARVGELVITLTGEPEGRPRPLVHRRFDRTLRQLEEGLGTRATPLPERLSRQAPPLAHLEASCFRSGVHPVESSGALELVEAPDRAAEARAALRWLKVRLLEEGMRPGEAALLARDISPYRPYILQTAAEFGLPVRLVGGLPLGSNPAIVGLLDLLRLLLPGPGDSPEPSLPRRLVVEAWRSPYFDWSARPDQGVMEPIGIGPGDAARLDAVARWGRVIAGRSQWEEALGDLAAREEPAGDGPPSGPARDEEEGPPAGVPVGPEAERLREAFHGFLQRLTPPPGDRTYREFVGWMEGLIGSDPALQSARYPAPEEPTALQVVVRAAAGDGPAVERDIAALRALKDVLRGLVWAEEALALNPVSYPRFVEELAGAVEAATYPLAVLPGREEVLIADVVQARGVPFRAVAVLGMAEGEFPALLSGDPFLRDGDRERLRQGFGLPLQPSAESAEVEFFYETITRARERLLLTRPRLDDSGASWQASPFWEEVRRLVHVVPEILTSETVPRPAQVASWPELMESLATTGGYGPGRAWAWQMQPARQGAFEAAGRLVRLRESHATHSPYDGDLSALAGELSRRFGPPHPWSASRLESYRTCPFSFFVGSVLGLEPRQEPSEGLDVRQLGSIYHRIFERLYRAAADPMDLAALQASLPQVAQAVLDEAPRREGFRATAWWQQTRAEIVEAVRRSVEGLTQGRGEFVPHRYEALFGLGGEPPLIVQQEQDSFRLRGLIDRVDRSPDGRVRVVDYKLAGPWAFTARAFVEGRTLQVPLYALAARDALGLGEPVDGFYWHVRHARPSDFTLSRFADGPAGAMALAQVHAWEAIRAAREGSFVPDPPDEGCPPYCPATAFCWHYRPGFGG